MTMQSMKKIFTNGLMISGLWIGLTVSAMAAPDFNQIQRLANQGDALAQTDLGIMYFTGNSVRQDYTQARQWYQKAANQGKNQAQFNLGLMYYLGQGVRQNEATAKEYFGKSCDNGLQDGCDNYRKLNQR